MVMTGLLGKGYGWKAVEARRRGLNGAGGCRRGHAPKLVLKPSIGLWNYFKVVYQYFCYAVSVKATYRGAKESCQRPAP